MYNRQLGQTVLMLSVYSSVTSSSLNPPPWLNYSYLGGTPWCPELSCGLKLTRSAPVRTMPKCLCVHTSTWIDITERTKKKSPCCIIKKTEAKFLFLNFVFFCHLIIKGSFIFLLYLWWWGWYSLRSGDEIKFFVFPHVKKQTGWVGTGPCEWFRLLI